MNWNVPVLSCAGQSNEENGRAGEGYCVWYGARDMDDRADGRTSDCAGAWAAVRTAVRRLAQVLQTVQWQRLQCWMLIELWLELTAESKRIVQR